MGEMVWVEVETTKSTDDTWSFKGQMLKAVFESVVSNRIESGYVKLDNVYWVSTHYDDYGNNKGRKVFKYGDPGRLKAYQGDIYLKIEHIVSISTIDAQVDFDQYGVEAKKHLCSVSPIRT